MGGGRSAHSDQLLPRSECPSYIPSIVLLPAPSGSRPELIQNMAVLMCQAKTCEAAADSKGLLPLHQEVTEERQELSGVST